MLRVHLVTCTVCTLPGRCVESMRTIELVLLYQVCILLTCMIALVCYLLLPDLTARKRASRTLSFCSTCTLRPEYLWSTLF